MSIPYNRIKKTISGLVVTARKGSIWYNKTTEEKYTLSTVTTA